VAWGKLGRCCEARPDSKEVSIRKLVFKFQMNLDFRKILRNLTRKFRNNLGIGIFPKFFRLLKDF
jgi:hypothetical protein